ncbi:cell division protein ZapB [Bacillus atrophaeus]|uniref:cell division protein ZapB n=1 Tax=Bacillus atrophaeus TaxID=1452 RepID=UPI002E216EEE|nr:cell division protein ZapB [Bacillus atrophaeus]
MYEGKSDGIVREVRDVRCDRVRVCKFMDEFGVWVDGFYHGIYRVLVPAEAEADEPQPADLIDVVSNLAEEVSKLKRKVSGLLTTIERHEDEIDTLHKDNRTLGEELARLKEPKDNKINYEDAALVFIQRKVAGSVEVYQDGKRLRGVISVNINAKVGELTTHTIEFGTGHTAGERP